jgi:ATP-binding cassette subfamily B protein
MKQSTKVTELLSVLMPLMTLVISLAVTIILWFGGQLIIEGTFTLGEMLAFYNYLMSTLFPLMFLAMVAGQLSAASASAERIVQVLDTEPKVQNNPNAKPLGNVLGRVGFEGVSFKYGNSNAGLVLKDINLNADPGQTVAILGATGSGKSTLVNLIPRFYDVTEGKVLIDGTDIRDVTLESLRSHIGIALQETVLFSGTIRDNIRYGRPSATDDEVVAVAKAAEAHEFIMSFPKGYDTELGERGVNLSGGEKQRIAIARALLLQPSILILDDSTSSVDIETEVKIQKALERAMKGRTSFVIAQRISTVLNADKIVVLEKGQIVAQGTHMQLMETSSVYREIYESQLGEGGVAS